MYQKHIVPVSSFYNYSVSRDTLASMHLLVGELVDEVLVLPLPLSLFFLWVACSVTPPPLPGSRVALAAAGALSAGALRHRYKMLPVASC